MKAKEALKITWKNLDEAVIKLQRDLDDLAMTIQERQPDDAGEFIQLVIAGACEIYMRIGVIGALEEVDEG